MRHEELIRLACSIAESLDSRGSLRQELDAALRTGRDADCRMFILRYGWKAAAKDTEIAIALEPLVARLSREAGAGANSA